MLTPEQKERVKLLVDALRSGKYRQTQYTLSKYDKESRRRKFCCLGVACEVAMQNGVELEYQRHQDGYGSYNNNSSCLPDVVKDWFGFDSFDPKLLDAEGNEYYATQLNDTLKLKFGKIADAFERTYLNEDRINEDATENADTTNA